MSSTSCRASSPCCRVGTVDLCRYGVSPSPNCTCTFQRIRLSILGYVPAAYFVNSQHSHDLLFGMGPKDCLPSPQPVAFDRVTTSYTLADPASLVAKPITGKRWVLWR